MHFGNQKDEGVRRLEGGGTDQKKERTNGYGQQCGGCGGGVGIGD